ncbi:MAG: helix-turn-helix domain-containing protein [Oscillospiraceae bacterium]|nr:helix-turn-helix domain-containing protein [Oscillospiraceae bacterium]
MNNTTVITQKDAYKLMLKDYPDVLSIDQMCEILGVSMKMGYRLLRDGKIACLKVGRVYRIPKAHLFTYLKIFGEASANN